MIAYFHASKSVRKMVDKTNYTDGSELTYQEKNHLVAYCTDIENYNAFYRTPPNYGEYVPLVHVLNYPNIHGDVMVRFLVLRHLCIFCINSSKTELHC